MADRFHVNSELGPGPVELSGDEARHLAVVCRIRPGARVCLFNGDGAEYPAVVEEVGKREVLLRVVGVERPARELPFRLTVAAALPKGDRAQMLVEKLTELGVAEFVPLRTARGVVLPREAKLDRLQRHVVEASKQCGRNVFMSVEPLTTWDDFRATRTDGWRLVAHPGGNLLGSSLPLSPEAGEGGVVIAVGPEGGFTDEEITRAVGAGWSPVGLGPRILRVETAAVALASWFSLVPQSPGSAET